MVCFFNNRFSALFFFEHFCQFGISPARYRQDGTVGHLYLIFIVWSDLPDIDNTGMMATAIPCFGQCSLKKLQIFWGDDLFLTFNINQGITPLRFATNNPGNINKPVPAIDLYLFSFSNSFRAMSNSPPLRKGSFAHILNTQTPLDPKPCGRFLLILIKQ